MRLLDLTLDTPAENLALDEALLNEADEAASRGSTPRETLRLWESGVPMVVLGRSSQAASEVKLSACQVRGVSVLRRASGGAAIVAGPGCLMYAVVLDYRLRPAVRPLEQAHRFVLETILGGLRPLIGNIARQGTSDLTLGSLKFSGNSLRMKRHAVLYHGTLLYDFDLSLVEQLLALPARQPAYRANRAHGSFITNLPLAGSEIRQALEDAWQTSASDVEWPRAQVRGLVEARYGRERWNLQR